jgi:hypothetical protein
MIERLNFYDVYGYLLPGLLLLFLLWLPFGLAARAWPPIEVGSALFALVISYIVGHILQGITREVLPSDLPSVRRFPSSALLDDSSNDIRLNDRLPSEVVGRLKARIRSEFGLDVSDTDHASGHTAQAIRDQRRQQAFFMCRRALLSSGAPSYAEQFQGLYALMRGVAGVCFLIAAYDSGWALSAVFPNALISITPAVLVILLASMIAFNHEKWIGFALVVAAAWIGVALGKAHAVPQSTREFLVVIAFGTAFVERRAIAAYRRFAMNFAQTVYRDFLVTLPNVAPSRRAGRPR